MNKEVNFEISKLLKDKGFMDKNMYGEVRLSQPKFYDNTGVIHDIKNAFENTGLNLKECYNAPTIAVVVMWLYEKHEIWIECLHRGMLGDFTFKVSKLKKGWRTEPHYIHESGYNSPTEAYEAAIKHTLENIK